MLIEGMFDLYVKAELNRFVVTFIEHLVLAKN